MNRVRVTWLLCATAAWICVILAAATRAAPQAPAGAEGWHIPEGAAAEANPMPPNADVLAKGKILYRAKCQRCHGADGTGHGPEADPGHPPADLTDGRRASRNPDGVMFYKIWNGRAKPRMPAMKADLAPGDVWMVIQYVKTLRKSAGDTALPFSWPGDPGGSSSAARSFRR